jgi:zinc transporter 1/2/3
MLISQGILDALSAGILIYDGLANIMIPHFNGKNFQHAPAWKKVCHFSFLWLGAGLMSVLGIWL